MPSPKPEERRLSERQPVKRLATMLTGNGAQPRYCRVTEISENGVRVNAIGFKVPDKFVLLFSGSGPAQDGNYSVIWRSDQEIGAEFIAGIAPRV
jgi:hypothetical protein